MFSSRASALLKRHLRFGPIKHHTQARCFHGAMPTRTDGVFKDLTEMRVRTPWIEALRQRKEEGIDPTKRSDVPATPADMDLSPRRMSDSYHRVVRWYQDLRECH